MGKLSYPQPEKVLEDIKKWATEKSKFIISPYDNPQSHFSVWITTPEPHKIIPIMVTYPKQDDKILMGWRWRQLELDIKAYEAIKDIGRKENIMRAVKSECLARNLTLGVNPNIYNLEEMAIHRILSVSDLTKQMFRNIILDLMYMWVFLMSQFEQHDMSRAGFNPSDYI
jgi:hypothetical protein